jgi:LacI family transcriptional regulator
MSSKIEKNFKKIEEIADHFGLSRSTVSYILNDKWKQRRINQATAEKVWDYVRAIGFKPNMMSLALRGRPIKEIAIIISDDPMEHHRNALFTLIRNLKIAKKSYLVLPASDADLMENIQFLKMSRVTRLIIFRFDGIQHLLDSLPDTSVEDYLVYDFAAEQLETMNTAFAEKSLSVGFDRRKAKTMVFDYVLQCGYRRIVLPRGYFEQMSSLPDLSDLDILYYDVKDVSDLGEAGEAVAAQLIKLNKSKTPQAVVMNDDKMTMAAMKYVQDHGIKVPEQLAFISWDGLPETKYFSLPISTLCVPHQQMMEITMQWVNGKLPANHARIVVEPGIRIGATLPSLLNRGIPA